ncbi:YdeI/OmpD-associated family protein [soil metagenome]
MTPKEIAAGVVHKVPADIRKALTSDPKALSAWDNITPLARNEWICWVESAKKQETRNSRIERVRKGLVDGKRRPCCWPGCPHRYSAQLSTQ